MRSLQIKALLLSSARRTLLFAAALLVQIVCQQCHPAYSEDVLARLPKNVPLDVQRLLAKQIAVNNPGQMANIGAGDFCEIVDRLRDLKGKYRAEVTPSWLLRSGLIRDESVGTLNGLKTGNPYRQAVAKISPKVLDQQLVGLVPHLLTPDERKAFVAAFSKVDFDKLAKVDLDRLSTDAEYANQLGDEGRVLASSKIIGMVLIPAAKYLGEKAIDAIASKFIDKGITTIVGSPDEQILKEQQAILVEMKALQDTVKDLNNKNSEKLNQIGSIASNNLHTSAADLLVSLYAARQVDQVLRLERDARKAIGDIYDAQDKIGISLKRLRDKVGLLGGKVDEINTHVGEIQETIVQDHFTLAKTAKQVETLLYDRWLDLPSQRKLEWLRAGRVDVAESEKDALVTRLKVDIAAQETEKYLTGGIQAMNVLSKLGFDATVTKYATEAMNIGKSLAHSISTGARGDYINAVVGFAAAIFGGGPDIEELRHQEIMNHLREIERLQRNTYEQTISVRLDIAELGRQIQQNQIRVMTQLKIIDSKLDTVLALTQEESLRPYSLLREKMRDKDNTTGRMRELDLEELVPKLQNDLDFRSHVVKGLDALELLAGTADGPYQPVLHFDAAPIENEWSKSVVEFWEDLRDSVKDPDPAHQQPWWSLQEPVQSVEQHQARCECTFRPPEWGDQFDILLRPERVVGFAETLLRVAPLCFFLRKTEAGLEFVDLGSGQSPDPAFVGRANKLYKSYSLLLDLAIAQQALLHGDVAVEQLANRLCDASFKKLVDALSETETDLTIAKADVSELVVAFRESGQTDDDSKGIEDEIRRRAKRLGVDQKMDEFLEKQKEVESRLFLKANPLMARNLLMYLLRSDAIPRESPTAHISPVTYDFFRQATESSYLQHALNRVGLPPEVTTDSSGLRVVMFPCSTLVPPPSPEMFVHGDYLVGRDFQRLVAVRAKLAEAMAGLAFKQKINADDNALLSKLFVSDSLSSTHAAGDVANGRTSR